jgi:hypothetical protein
MIYDPIIADPLNLFTASSLTVSGGATPSRTSDPVTVGKLSKLHVFVSNAGASTNCTITIYGKPTPTSPLNSTLAVFTLGAASGETPYTAGRYIEGFPSYVYAVITNADVANTASITITLNRFR